MARIRRDVWALGPGWNDTTLYYARAVAKLQQRPITDRTSWTFLAAMHGIDPDLWQSFGYLDASGTLASGADQKRYWRQCQHQTWYFLPWHRGYLAAFENIVRAAVIDLGGPADWALPYWNYNNPAIAESNQLPWCFSQPQLPDGSANPLFVTRRYGSGAGPIVLDPRLISADQAMADTQFAGQSAGGSAGFGGPQTRFHHGGEQDGVPSGDLENSPHNAVHSLVGGSLRGADPNDPLNLGLMSMPDTAALDPVFWVHHANIDRLWEAWLRASASNRNPTVVAWLNGPARPFAMPTEAGADYTFAPKDVLDLGAEHLGYEYEDLAAAQPPGAAELAVTTMKPKRTTTELLGANTERLALVKSPVQSKVHLDGAVKSRVTRSFAQGVAAPGAGASADRVFLNLENIRGLNDAAVFSVYLGPAAGAAPSPSAQQFVGSVSLFGAAKASAKDDAHGGKGLTAVLDVTRAIQGLHQGGSLDADHLVVNLVPETDLAPKDPVSVGRISLYRTGR